jgi:hypothetical protein
VDGVPVRATAAGESGEVVLDEGEPTELDEDLLPAAATNWERLEQRVMGIARAWSVDPTMLDEREDLPDSGLLGYRR